MPRQDVPPPGRAAPRAPARRARPRSPPGTAARAQAAAASGARSASWPLVAVIALVAIAAVLIADSTSNTVVHYKKVVGHDAQSVISQVQGLINQYTK